jgi:peptidoglycan-associated lipoprotein
MNKRNLSAIVLAFSLFFVAEACKKQPPPPPPPPPPPVLKEKPAPPRPTISTFVAEPATIERGQASTLRWSVSNATAVSIDQGIGTVQASGDRKVFPSGNTTYTLTAKGEGGEATATARVTVTQPPPPPPPKPAAPKKTVSQRLSEEVQDAFFDYDKYDIRSDAQQVLTGNAGALRSIMQEFPNAVITIEGHCDERGSAEYNLALGDRRATSAREFLTQLGISGSNLRTVSYGKERPQCTESNEECWQRNRRVHFSAGQ